VRRYSIVLGILAFAFFLRVLGQVLVAFFGVDFLPPMDAWYSGLMPYPLLLPAQIAILALQFEISRELWTGHGPLTRRNARLGEGLKWASLVYFLAMVARGLWFGLSIPVFFHWVLAAYLYVLSRYHREG
jgi:hypothetical protein